MRLAVKDRLTEQEIESGLRAVIKDGMASTAMATLTGGAFLVAFALKLGASNLVIGLLAAIPPLAQLIQIPSIYLVERIQNRRLISMAASMGGRILWLFIALIPFLFPKEGGLNFLIVAILINAAFIAVSNCSWNSWMRDLVPQDRLGAFFSRRMSLSVGLSIVLSLAAAFYIDYWKRQFPHPIRRGIYCGDDWRLLYIDHTGVQNCTCGGEGSLFRVDIEAIQGRKFQGTHYVFGFLEFRRQSGGSLLYRIHAQEIATGSIAHYRLHSTESNNEPRILAHLGEIF
jgi:hypothetical protein